MATANDNSDINQISENATSASMENLNVHGEINVLNSQNVITKNVTYISGCPKVNGLPSNVARPIKRNETSYAEHDGLHIVSRQQWMAEAPRQRTTLQNAAKFVVISHTATEEGFSDPENTLLVKLVQSFHMDCHEWDDIAYNFLIGNNGNVYEGRGWNIQGAHTFGYNPISIGISFIGCYMNHLPTKEALKAAQALINYGVRFGYISQEYSLVGHCQCSPVESPGYQLYMEIKKWPKWRELTSSDSKI